MIWEENVLRFKDQDIKYGKGVPSESKAVVLIIHGFAEHMGRYQDLISFLQARDYGVYAMNHLGHGGSGNVKGHIDDFFHLVDSVHELVNIAKEENSDLPIYMMGHSMGGLVSIAYGIRYPEQLNGQILSAPALGISMPKPLELFLKLSRLITPKMYLGNQVAKDISRDEDVVERYLRDELVLKKATLNFYYEVFLRGTKYVKENSGEYKYPHLLLHGTHDKIIASELSNIFHKNSSSKDKSIKLYQGLYHELLNEPEKDQVKDDMYNWLEMNLVNCGNKKG